MAGPVSLSFAGRSRQIVTPTSLISEASVTGRAGLEEPGLDGLTGVPPAALFDFVLEGLDATGLELTVL